MISTLIFRGLAFGRSVRVGFDGSLTGSTFFFSLRSGAGSGREEENLRRYCDSFPPAQVLCSEWAQSVACSSPCFSFALDFRDVVFGLFDTRI